MAAGRAAAVSRSDAAPALPPREQELRAAVAQAPQDRAARRRLGEYLAGTERPAEGLWELAIAAAPGVGSPPKAGGGAEEAVALAAALREVGQPETARAVLTEARERHADDLSLTLALAETALSLGRAEEAAALFAAGAARETPEGLRMLARARYALGDAEGARQALLAAREIGGPFPPPAQQAACDVLLGRMALDRGQANEARARLAAAAAVREEDAALLFDLGRAWELPAPGSASGEPDAEATTRARESYVAALRRDPRHAGAMAALARLVHEAAGRWREAADAYGKALALDPRLVAAEEGLARVLARMGMPAEAAYPRARAARLRGRLEAALPLYREWGRLRPERWEAPLREAETLQEMRRATEAVRVLAAAVKRFPESAPLHAQLAQLYRITSNPAAAERLLPRWEALDPASGQPEWLRGRIAADAGRRADALAAFEAARAKNPRQPAFALAIAETLLQDPHPENLRRARELLEAAAASDPRNAAYLPPLGAALTALGEADAARTTYLRALDRDPRRVELYGLLVPLASRAGQGGAATLFARLARNAREQARAEAAARDRLWLNPARPEARQALALALLRRGDLAGARDQLEALAASPAGAARLAADQKIRRVRALLALSD